MKKIIRQIVPESLRIPVNNTLNFFYVLKKTPPEERYWSLHPHAITSRRRMRALKDIHKGRRCFIIGNGPSLNKMDLSPLANEITFGLNRVYLLFPKIGFNTTYLVSVNKLVLDQCNKDMMQLDIPLFLSWRSHQYVPLQQNVIFMNSLYKTGSFSFNPTKGIYESGTVTCAALQLAYYMGFVQVILIGVDHNFSTKGPANQTVTSDGKDSNHFDPNYFGKGFKWQLPDLESSEAGYRAAKIAYESNDREIFDATIGGKLQVFNKVEFSSLF